MTEIYLIRHTQAEGNLYRMMQGHWDGDITPLGALEIDALAERFRNIDLHAVYSSDLYRAMLTAGGVTRYNGLDIIKDVRLRELNMGPWEAQFFGNVTREDPESANAFLYSPADWHIPGAETLADVTQRAWPALVEMAEENEGHAVAAVSHGVTIRCLLSRILNKPLSGTGDIVPIVKNTAVTKLIYENGSFTAEYVGDASHIAGLKVSDWIANDGLRDEIFDPRTDPELYISCYADAWKSAHNGSPDGFEADVYLSSAISHHLRHPGSVLKLFNNDEFVGLVDMDTDRGSDADYGWISLLYLIPEYRDRGYGIQLLGRAMVLYRDLGRSALRLYSALSNTQALRFYEKSGFTAISHEKGCCGPIALMEKKIGGRADVH